MAAPVIILLGMTGAGKSTQAADLAKKEGWTHLSSGDLLRSDPITAAALKSGDLAPVAEVDRLVAQALEAAPEDQTIVMDGFPRELSQAKWLEDKLGQLGRPLRHVIYLVTSQAETQRRLALRGRSDDSEAAEEKKHDWFEHDTLQVIEHYRQQGVLIEVSGDPAPEVVSEAIEQVVA